MKEWFDRLIGKTADENVIKDSTMMQTKRAIEQAQKQSQKGNLMTGSTPDNKFPSVNYNDAELARQQMQQAYSQAKSSYIATTSTPNGVVTNIPGQRNLNLLRTGGYYNSPQMPTSPSQWGAVRQYKDLTDEEKAFVIVNTLARENIKEMSGQVAMLVIKELASRQPQTSTPEKQPKKKLEL